MKKVLMLVALFLGTTVLVNAQEPVKAAPAKEVKVVKKAKMEKKAEAAKPAAAPAKKAEAKK